VTTMQFMFYQATSFDQTVCWNITSDVDTTQWLDGTNGAVHDVDGCPVPLHPLATTSPTYAVNNGFAFAILSANGSVHTFGEAPYGGNSSTVSSLLTNVSSVIPSRFTYTATKADGSVVTWGIATANSHEYQSSNSVVPGSVVATEAAYAFLSSEGVGGRVLAFGSKHHGGDVVTEKYSDGFSA